MSTLRIWVMIIRDGAVTSSILTRIEPEGLIYDVRKDVAQQLHVAPDQVCLWNPRAHIGHKNTRDLRERLERNGNDLKSFCDQLDEVVELKDFLRASSSYRRRKELWQTASSALIADVFEIPEKAKITRQPANDGQEVRDSMISELIRKYKSTLNIKRSSPSVNAQPSNYLRYQAGSCPIRDGRYCNSEEAGTTLSVPVEIYHPAFALFLAHVKDKTSQPPEEFVRLTASMMSSTSKIETTENHRQFNTRGSLSRLLDCGAIQVMKNRKTSAGYFFPHNCQGNPVGVAALAIVEEKPELGTSDEGSVQGSFSYIDYWTDQDQKSLREACFCPSFIISIAGPWIVVLGAIFTSEVIVQRLTDYIWIGDSRVMDNQRILSNARVLYGLRQAMKHLQSWYDTSLSSIDFKDRFFPSATSYVNANGRVNFRYVRPLKSFDVTCNVFLAVDCKSHQPLVVKFVERYGEDAHRVLAEIGRAPTLLYCGPIWSDESEQSGCGECKMVVMEYIEGKTVAQRYVDEAPESVREVVRHAVMHLHDQEMVHGDVRPPNIMIEDADGEDGDDKDDEDSEAQRVKFIDFDWAGVVGQARYPFHLASTVKWPEAAVDYGLIEKEHDIEMTEQL